MAEPAIHPGTGLVRYRRIAWFPVATRKAHQCCVCKATIAEGDVAFRPFGESKASGVERSHRLCVGCAEGNGGDRG